MIKTHEERPQYNITVTDAIICDLCKKEFPDGWIDEFYREIDTEVSYYDREVYPDDVCDNEKIEIDICPDCFKNRLIPWLKSQGADIRVAGDYA